MSYVDDLGADTLIFSITSVPVSLPTGSHWVECCKHRQDSLATHPTACAVLLAECALSLSPSHSSSLAVFVHLSLSEPIHRDATLLGDLLVT